MKTIEELHYDQLQPVWSQLGFLNMLENLSMTKSVVQLPKTIQDYPGHVAGLLYDLLRSYVVANPTPVVSCLISQGDWRISVNYSGHLSLGLII